MVKLKHLPFFFAPQLQSPLSRMKRDTPLAMIDVVTHLAQFFTLEAHFRWRTVSRVWAKALSRARAFGQGSYFLMEPWKTRLVCGTLRLRDLNFYPTFMSVVDTHLLFHVPQPYRITRLHICQRPVDRHRLARRKTSARHNLSQLTALQHLNISATTVDLCELPLEIWANTLQVLTLGTFCNRRGAERLAALRCLTELNAIVDEMDFLAHLPQLTQLRLVHCNDNLIGSLRVGTLPTGLRRLELKDNFNALSLAALLLRCTQLENLSLDVHELTDVAGEAPAVRTLELGPSHLTDGPRLLAGPFRHANKVTLTGRGWGPVVVAHVADWTHVQHLHVATDEANPPELRAGTNMQSFRWGLP